MGLWLQGMASVLSDAITVGLNHVIQERLHTTRTNIVDGYLRAYENAQRDVR